MALGICLGKDCGRAVSILPREHAHEDKTRRERVWYPVAHDKPDGTVCIDGPKKGIRQ